MANTSIGKRQDEFAELAFQGSRSCGRDGRRLSTRSGQVKAASPLDLAPCRAYVSALRTPDRFRSELQPQAEVAVPRIKSAKKRMRQARARTTHNRTIGASSGRRSRRCVPRPVPRPTPAYAEAVKLLDRAGRRAPDPPQCGGPAEEPAGEAGGEARSEQLRSRGEASSKMRRPRSRRPCFSRD